MQKKTADLGSDPKQREVNENISVISTKSYIEMVLAQSEKIPVQKFHQNNV